MRLFSRKPKIKTSIPIDVLESVSAYHDQDARHKFISDGFGFCIICTNKKFECQFCKRDVRMAGGTGGPETKSTCNVCLKGMKK